MPVEGERGVGRVSVPKTKSDDSVHRHEGERRRRRKVGGDPFQRYARGRDARERRTAVIASVLLLMVLAACFGYFAR
ncbi:MAG: hypothetical protein JWM82_1781 [Myxococcales bacterium]|nr:hypothetical protein [Myxococcales bacterium]